MPRSPEPKSQVRLQWHCCHQLAHVTLMCPRMIFQPFTCLAKCTTIQSNVQYNNKVEILYTKHYNTYVGR